MNDSGIFDDGQMSRESSVIRMPSRQKSDLVTPLMEEASPDFSSVNEEAGMVGSKLQLATPRSRLPLPGSGSKPSFTHITRKSKAPIPNKAVSNIQQPFQREKSFVETNFVQTTKSSNITRILPVSEPGGSGASTPGSESGGKGSATGSPALTEVILSGSGIKRRKIGGVKQVKRRRNIEAHIDHNYVIRTR